MHRLANNKVRLLGAACLAAVLAGCSTTQVLHAPVGPEPVAINPTYQAGYVDIQTTPVPSLDQILNRVPERSNARASSNEDRLRCAMPPSPTAPRPASHGNRARSMPCCSSSRRTSAASTTSSA